jgi:hypothetical protein
MATSRLIGRPEHLGQRSGGRPRSRRRVITAEQMVQVRFVSFPVLTRVVRPRIERRKSVGSISTTSTSPASTSRAKPHRRHLSTVNPRERRCSYAARRLAYVRHPSDLRSRRFAAPHEGLCSIASANRFSTCTTTMRATVRWPLTWWVRFRDGEFVCGSFATPQIPQRWTEGRGVHSPWVDGAP